MNQRLFTLPPEDVLTEQSVMLLVMLPPLEAEAEPLVASSFPADIPAPDDTLRCASRLVPAR